MRARVAIALVVVAAAVTSACASILDIPDVTLGATDGGADGSEATDGAAPRPDGGPARDAGGVDTGCGDDPAALCQGKCDTTVTGACNEPITCPSTCPNSGTCLANHTCCTPVDKATWCATRCGATTDSCGQPIDCGGCDGGVACTQGACGCVPEPPSTACGAKQCGTAKNNCNQDVPCGANGTVNCGGANDVCMPDQTCCTPNDVAACNGKQCGKTTDNCGLTVTCPNTCTPQGLCGIGDAGPNGCCAPSCASATCGGSDGCGGTCNTNNGCAAPKSCNGTSCATSCVQASHCTGGASNPCGGGQLLWNCPSQPANTSGCTQVCIGVDNYAFCCPP